MNKKSSETRRGTVFPRRCVKPCVPSSDYTEVLNGGGGKKKKNGRIVKVKYQSRRCR